MKHLPVRWAHFIDGNTNWFIAAGVAPTLLANINVIKFGGTGASKGDLTKAIVTTANRRPLLVLHISSQLLGWQHHAILIRVVSIPFPKHGLSKRWMVTQRFWVCLNTWASFLWRNSQLDAKTAWVPHVLHEPSTWRLPTQCGQLFNNCYRAPSAGFCEIIEYIHQETVWMTSMKTFSMMR